MRVGFGAATDMKTTPDKHHPSTFPDPREPAEKAVFFNNNAFFFIERNIIRIFAICNLAKCTLQKNGYNCP